MIIRRIKIQRRGRVWKHIMGYIHVFAQYFFVFLCVFVPKCEEFVKQPFLQTTVLLFSCLGNACKYKVIFS